MTESVEENAQKARVLYGKLADAYPYTMAQFRIDVIAEVVEALRQESKRVRFVAAWRNAADFIEREFGIRD